MYIDVNLEELGLGSSKPKPQDDEKSKHLFLAMDQYKTYRISYAQNLLFDHDLANLSNITNIVKHKLPVFSNNP